MKSQIEKQVKICCDNHGIHEHFIKCDVDEFTGYYCMKCWIEGLKKCELVLDKESSENTIM